MDNSIHAAFWMKRLCKLVKHFFFFTFVKFLSEFLSLQWRLEVLGDLTRYALSCPLPPPPRLRPQAKLSFVHPVHFTLSYKVSFIPALFGGGRRGLSEASELLQKWILCYIAIFDMLELELGRFLIIVPRILASIVRYITVEPGNPNSEGKRKTVRFSRGFELSG